MSTFSVINTNDSGIGSLGQAILNANALSGKDIINFDGVFTDNIADTITLTRSSLRITDDLSIEGIGANLLTISGNSNSENSNEENAFSVFEITSNVTVEIEGLTIANGYSGQYGSGGITNYGSLTLSDSTISGNSAYYEGGGISNYGSLTLSNSTISGNGAGNGVGGIYNTGIATLLNSSVSDNGGFIWGGIYNTGSLAVYNSTISGNRAERQCGGIINSGSLTLSNSTISNNEGGILYIEYPSAIDNSSTAMVSNSTITGNRGNGNGIISNSGNLTLSNSTISDNYGNGATIFNNGTLVVSNNTISGNQGVSNISNDGILTVSNSTITFNIAFDISGKERSVAGISNSNSGTATIKNSIIAGNFDYYYNDRSQARNSDVVGNFNSNGFNLIGNLNGSKGFNKSEQLNVPITDLLNISLQDNGGGVKTHALVTGSPAINAGLNADVAADITDLDDDGDTAEPVPFDGRGSGYQRISGGRVDIGAYEAAVNVINGTPERDSITGTAANDIITGYQGRDSLTGGTGADEFIYTTIRDIGDTITDFEVGTDKIVLKQLLENLNIGNLNFEAVISGGYLGFETQGSNTIVLIDPDGSSGRGRSIKFLKINNVTATDVNSTVNFVF
jgi:hypothetical protein